MQRQLSLRIAELAVPKGMQAHKCEICGTTATTKCGMCNVTRYCTHNHKLIDFVAFHKRICPKMADLRRERTMQYSHEDRQQAKRDLLRKKEAIITEAEDTARFWLIIGPAKHAYPPSMIALNMAEQLTAVDNIAVIFPSCLASEMFMQVGDMQAAHDYMAHASWVAKKNKNVPPDILIHLYRLKGVLYMMRKKWPEAIKAFSERVCTVALNFGVLHIRIANAYAHLGLALIKSGNAGGSMACFHKVTDRWLHMLLHQYVRGYLRCATQAEMAERRQTRELEFEFIESKVVMRSAYEEVRYLGVNATTDLLNFKILCVLALQEMRMYGLVDTAVFVQEALATAVRTRQDAALPEDETKILMKVLGEDYIQLWDDRHIRPRTYVTKYLEQIKAIN